MPLEEGLIVQQGHERYACQVRRRTQVLQRGRTDHLDGHACLGSLSSDDPGPPESGHTHQRDKNEDNTLSIRHGSLPLTQRRAWYAWSLSIDLYDLSLPHGAGVPGSSAGFCVHADAYTEDRDRRKSVSSCFSWGVIPTGSSAGSSVPSRVSGGDDVTET